MNYNNDTGEAVEPSNEFEKMLLRDVIEVRSDENYKKYMYIGKYFRFKYISIGELYLWIIYFNN